MKYPQQFTILIIVILLHNFSKCSVYNVTYEELENLKSCYPRDNCRENRDIDDLREYNCHCGQFCQNLDTCCVDSKYNTDLFVIDPRIKCVQISNYGFSVDVQHAFMVKDCMPGWADHSIERLCNSDGKEMDDPFFSIPVTNLITGITYKNYYCSVCNNDTSDEQLASWDLILKSKSEEVMSNSIPELHYNSSNEKWTIKADTENKEVIFMEVILSVSVPAKLAKFVRFCVPELISECASNWTDSSTEFKCKSYMAISRFLDFQGERAYRNPHCAICNFENIEEMECFIDKITFSIQTKVFYVGLFSLHDKIKKCEGNKFYDRLADRCRTVYKG